MRRTGSGHGYHVTIPVTVGRLVGTDRLYRVELTEEGILLRYVDGGSPVDLHLPEWLKDGGDSRA